MMKKIYIANLYRFGYDLEVAAETEDEARENLLAEYIRAYKDINGSDPSEDITIYGNSYLENAGEDIEIREHELGKVEWR